MKTENPDLTLNTINETSSVPLETAVDILGAKRVLGSSAIETTFGISVDMPPIPFSEERLLTAEAMKQMLVLRVDNDRYGRPLTVENMGLILDKDWGKRGMGRLLNYPNYHGGWKNRIKFEIPPGSASPRPGWALVSTTMLPESQYQSPIGQTRTIVETLASLFKGSTMPDSYAAAITLFEQQLNSGIYNIDGFDLKNRLVLSEIAEKTSRALFDSGVWQLTRRHACEIVYDSAMYFEMNGERLHKKEEWDVAIPFPDFDCLAGVGEFSEDGISYDLTYAFSPIDGGAYISLRS